MTSSVQGLAGRIAVALLFVLLASGSVLATAATLPSAQTPSFAEPSQESSPEAKESPDADENEDGDENEDADGSPSPANLARIVERLAAAGLITTEDDLAALAASAGVGGAIRVLRFADAAGMTPAEILALREGGKGWGVIARELDLDIGPGIGPVMGKGQGLDKAAKAAAKAARAEARAARAAERAQRQAGSGD